MGLLQPLQIAANVMLSTLYLFMHILAMFLSQITLCNYLYLGGNSETEHIRGHIDDFDDLNRGAPSVFTTNEIVLSPTLLLISLYLYVNIQF